MKVSIVYSKWSFPVGIVVTEESSVIYYMFRLIVAPLLLLTSLESNIMENRSSRKVELLTEVKLGA